VDPHEAALAGRRWFTAARRRRDFFHESVYAALRAHRAGGADLVLVSGAFAPIVGPIAEHIGARYVEVTRLVVAGGRYTGELLGPPVIGAMKAQRVRRLLRAHPEVAAADCYAYGDHLSDLPMLAAVGHPQIVGGDRALAEHLPDAPVLAVG
jgi:HAD superfamily hydrolase (TIGR01490 family)